MLNFEIFVARHGEFGTQALVERMERYEGIQSASGSSLEERWHVLMEARCAMDPRMAA